MEGYGNENPGAFQPTRPLRGATIGEEFIRVFIIISTHAPLAGRDQRQSCRANPDWIISTHAPLAGRDMVGLPDTGGITPYFNPRAPCGARHGRPAGHGWNYSVFQPTRPLRGATGEIFEHRVGSIFQPTRPLRGATGQLDIHADTTCISTHAPLAGRDPIPILE